MFKEEGGFPWSIVVESLTALSISKTAELCLVKCEKYTRSQICYNYVHRHHPPSVPLDLYFLSVSSTDLIFVSLFYWSTGAAGVRPRGIQKASCLQTPLNRFLSHNLSQFRRARTKKWEHFTNLFQSLLSQVGQWVWGKLVNGFVYNAPRAFGGGNGLAGNPRSKWR